MQPVYYIGVKIKKAISLIYWYCDFSDFEADITYYRGSKDRAHISLMYAPFCLKGLYVHGLCLALQVNWNVQHQPETTDNSGSVQGRKVDPSPKSHTTLLIRNHCVNILHMTV